MKKRETLESLEIVNSDGVTVIRMGCDKSGWPKFEMINPLDECARATIEVQPNHVSISVLHKDGSLAAGIGWNSSSGGGISIFTPSGECGSSLSANRDGSFKSSFFSSPTKTS